MAKYKFYALWGNNGLGVYRSWSKAEVSLVYLEKGTCKGFATYGEARKCAAEGYKERSGGCEFEGPFPSDFILRADDIEEINKLGIDPGGKVKLEFKDGVKKFKKG